MTMRKPQIIFTCSFITLYIITLITIAIQETIIIHCIQWHQPHKFYNVVNNSENNNKLYVHITEYIFNNR